MLPPLFYKYNVCIIAIVKSFNFVSLNHFSLCSKRKTRSRCRIFHLHLAPFVYFSSSPFFRPTSQPMIAPVSIIVNIITSIVAMIGHSNATAPPIIGSTTDAIRQIIAKVTSELIIIASFESSFLVVIIGTVKTFTKKNIRAVYRHTQVCC